MVFITASLLILLPALAAHAHDNPNHHARNMHGAHAARLAAAAALEERQGPAYPTGPGYDPLPLSSVVGLSATDTRTEPTVSLPETFAPAATNTLAGAPPLPDFSSTFNPANWPGNWQAPADNSPQVAEWMKELDGHDIPTWSPTVYVEGGDPCANNAGPLSEAGADKRCWWTCGGCTADTDITTCDDKMTWGLTFDDGPGFYTPKLLTWLESKEQLATFFLIGSNVVARPDTVRTEYMTGHTLAVHTWSHPSLTSLNNSQIVAELGWTREAIKNVTGVTPRFMRPPFGDIDNRVRAISNAMGLTPIIWTSVPGPVAGNPIEFDSNDWRVHGGMNSTEAKADLDTALALAPGLNTGVIVLQHDVYQETVDLAIGSTLPEAQGLGFKFEDVLTCKKQPIANAYVETFLASGGTIPSSGGSGGSSGGSSGNSTVTSAPAGASGKPAGTGSSTASKSSSTTSGAIVGREAAGALSAVVMLVSAAVVAWM